MPAVPPPIRIRSAVDTVLPQLGYEFQTESQGGIRNWRDSTATIEEQPDPGKHVDDEGWEDGQYWIHASDDLEEDVFDLLLHECGVKVEGREDDWEVGDGTDIVSLTMTTMDFKSRHPCRMKVGFGKLEWDGNSFDWATFVSKGEWKWKRRHGQHGRATRRRRKR